MSRWKAEVDELAVLFVPLPYLSFARDVRRGAPRRRVVSVARIACRVFLCVDRGKARTVERPLVPLALVVGQAVVTVGAAARGTGLPQRLHAGIGRGFNTEADLAVRRRPSW